MLSLLYFEVQTMLNVYPMGWDLYKASEWVGEALWDILDIWFNILQKSKIEASLILGDEVSLKFIIQ